MAINFEDGSKVPTEDWSKMLALIAELGNDSKRKPVEIVQDGVTIKVGNLEINKKKQTKQDHENYVESNIEGWTVRVWQMKKEEMYGCNYFKGNDIRYLEFNQADFRDENGVFKYMKSIIEEI